jgi:hypothetical protein
MIRPPANPQYQLGGPQAAPQAAPPTAYNLAESPLLQAGPAAKAAMPNQPTGPTNPPTNLPAAPVPNKVKAKTKGASTGKGGSGDEKWQDKTGQALEKALSQSMTETRALDPEVAKQAVRNVDMIMPMLTGWKEMQQDRKNIDAEIARVRKAPGMVRGIINPAIMDDILRTTGRRSNPQVATKAFAQMNQGRMTDDQRNNQLATLMQYKATLGQQMAATERQVLGTQLKDRYKVSDTDKYREFVEKMMGTMAGGRGKDGPSGYDKWNWDKEKWKEAQILKLTDRVDAGEVKNLTNLLGQADEIIATNPNIKGRGEDFFVNLFRTGATPELFQRFNVVTEEDKNSIIALNKVTDMLSQSYGKLIYGAKISDAERQFILKTLGSKASSTDEEVKRALTILSQGIKAKVEGESRSFREDIREEFHRRQGWGLDDLVFDFYRADKASGTGAAPGKTTTNFMKDYLKEK